MAIEKKSNRHVGESSFNEDVPLSVVCSPGQQRDFELEEKFKTMAETDMRVNGSYLNQPYKILHNHRVHKGRVTVKKIVESLVLSVEDPRPHAMPRADVLCNIDLKCD